MSDALQDKEQFYNFLLKCSDFKNIEFKDFSKINIGTELFVVNCISYKDGISNYALRKFFLLDFDETEKYIELEDHKKNYAGQFLFGDDGNIIYSINPISGKPDVFEKTFLDYISAIHYMSHLKFTCDIKDEELLLKIFQRLTPKGFK